MSNFVAKFLYEGRVNEHSALAATSGDSGAKNFWTIILSSLGLFFKLFAENHKWCWIQTSYSYQFETRFILLRQELDEFKDSKGDTKSNTKVRVIELDAILSDPKILGLVCFHVKYF